MTTIEFYKQLSTIMDNYRYLNVDLEKSTKKLMELNKAAADAGLTVKADPKLFESLKEEVQDELYDDSYEESYDSYDESY